MLSFVHILVSRSVEIRDPKMGFREQPSTNNSLETMSRSRVGMIRQQPTFRSRIMGLQQTAIRTKLHWLYYNELENNLLRVSITGIHEVHNPDACNL